MALASRSGSGAASPWQRSPRRRSRPAPGLPTDNRTWTAIKVELVDASLTVGENLKITDIDGTFQLNNATGAHDTTAA